MSDGCGLPTNPDDTAAEPTFEAEESNCVVTAGPGTGEGPGGGEDFPFPPDEEPILDPEVFAGPREFFADFNTSTHEITELGSLIRRPDAVSFKYLTAFSIGPIANGDASGGTRARIWKMEAINDPDTDTGFVQISRSNDAHDDWDAPAFLFAFSGQAVEADIAFEQAGRPVVVLEIAGRIWLYWFDPIPADFVLDNLDEGRTPRILLDNPEDTTDSDVILFYINDTDDDVVYRVQRERYQIKNVSPVSGVTNLFIDECFKTTDNRIAVVMSRRNTVTGRYSLERLESTLYPFFTDEDALDVTQLLQSGLLEDVVIPYTTDIEALDVAQLLQSGSLVLPLILHTLFDIDAFDVEQQIQSGTLVVVVIEHTLFDVDALDVAQLLQSGALVAVVIEHTLFDIDAFDVAQQIQSGSLVVP